MAADLIKLEIMHKYQKYTINKDKIKTINKDKFKNADKIYSLIISTCNILISDLKL